MSGVTLHFTKRIVSVDCTAGSLDNSVVAGIEGDTGVAVATVWMARVPYRVSCRQGGSDPTVPSPRTSCASTSYPQSL